MPSLFLFSLYLEKFSTFLKNRYKLGKSNNIPFKKPSTEKKLNPPESQSSKVNTSHKVRPFCGLHIKCINITNTVHPLLMCFKKKWPGGGGECQLLIQITILFDATNCSCELYSCTLQNCLYLCLPLSIMNYRTKKSASLQYFDTGLMHNIGKISNSWWHDFSPILLLTIRKFSYIVLKTSVKITVF